MRDFCTFDIYLKRPPIFFTNHLFKPLSGQAKQLGIASSILDLTAYATACKVDSHLKSHPDQRALGDLKIVFNSLKTGQELPSLQSHYVRAGESLKKLHKKWQRREKIESSDVLEIIVRLSALIKKTLSMLGNGLFKPLKLIYKYAETAGGLQHVLLAWRYLSLFKSGTKIVYLSGKLLHGSRKPLHRIVELVIEVLGALASCLRLARLHIHPALTIIHSVAKTLFTLYKIYEKASV